VIPSQSIARLIEDGAVTAIVSVAADQIQPASLDLRLGREASRVRASFCRARSAWPSGSRSSRCTGSTCAAARCSRRAASTSCPLMEALALPRDVAAVANAKSSTGGSICSRG
jgi:dCTP deaminase